MTELFLRGGPLMWPILLCSILALWVVADKFLEYKKILKEFSGSFSEILERRPECIRPIMEAVEGGATERELSLIGTRVVRRLERRLSWLALISVVTPLLGLTGTVTGMIKAFMVISIQRGGVEIGMLAGGIWEALLTTAAGLIVAVPAHVAYHWLDGQMEEIALMMKEIGIYLSSNSKILSQGQKDGV